jgi:hypothetical protein
MTATPYPAESFGMQQIQRRYGASAARLAKATRHEPGHAPAPAYPHLEHGFMSVSSLAAFVRVLSPADAIPYLEFPYAAIRDAAIFAVCAVEVAR